MDALCARFGKDLPCPTHFVHLPALPVVNAKFKAFDEARFQKDWEIQVHSAVKLCKAVLPAMSKAKLAGCCLSRPATPLAARQKTQLPM